MRAWLHSASRLSPFVLGLFLAACSNYQLGTAERPPFSSLYIEPVEVKVLLPEARALISAQVRSAFVKDGRVAIVDSPEAAEAVLKVVVTDYSRRMVATRESDIGLASKFALTMSATCTLRDTRTGRPLFENRLITTERDLYTDNGQPSSPLTGNQLQSEFNTLPLLAGSLADRITHAVLDVW